MPKEPHKDRDKDIEEIAQRRSAGFEEPNGPKDEKQRGEHPRKFRYTYEQRRVIKSALRPNKRLAAKTLNAIELLVGLTATDIQYRADNPVSPEQEKKFRDLERPIRQILEILDHPEFKHLKSYVPHLRRELSVLQHMVDLDQRKRPGRPQDPLNERLKDLYGRLAKIWAEHRGWPTRYGRGDLGRDWGPYYRFLDACLNPADIPTRDHVVRSVIEKRDLA